MTDFDLTAYLARVGLEKPVETTAAGLEELHRAHGFHIPYENFDILLGRGVRLEAGDLFEKIVEKRRGGYCFEQNELFLLALHALGFTARRLLARLHLPAFPATRVHEMLLIDLDGDPWIADVGCGSVGLRAPIRFALDRQTEQDGECFQLTEAPPFGTMFQTRQNDAWYDIASFDLEHVSKADLEMSNYYASTNASLVYSRRRIATLNTPVGRTSLIDMELRETSNGHDRVTTLEEGEPYLAALLERFGIALGAPYEALGKVGE